MSKSSQPQQTKGSQKWLQVLVNECPNLLAERFLAASRLSLALEINWLSPLVSESYAEYRNSDFTERLGITLPDATAPHGKSLKEFWPERGPVWDGLGKSTEGHLILIEAKAHLSEVARKGTTATAEKSLNLIEHSLQEAKKSFGANEPVDWSKTFYQYTNRLAHLYFLRELNKLPAYMVNVYFVNDTDMRLPASKAQWQAKIQKLKGQLGIKHTSLDKYCIDLFFDVNELKKRCVPCV